MSPTHLFNIESKDVDHLLLNDFQKSCNCLSFLLGGVRVPAFQDNRKRTPQCINSYFKMSSPGYRIFSFAYYISFFCPFSRCSPPRLPFEISTLSPCGFGFLGCGFVFIAGMRGMASHSALSSTPVEKKLHGSVAQGGVPRSQLWLKRLVSYNLAHGFQSFTNCFWTVVGRPSLGPKPQNWHGQLQKEK